MSKEQQLIETINMQEWPKQAIALHTHNAQYLDELSFSKNDILTITGPHVDAGWYTCAAYVCACVSTRAEAHTPFCGDHPHHLSWYAMIPMLTDT